MMFKDILRELRTECDLTHAELAQKIKFNKSSISLWESGKNEPTGKALIALAKAFDVSTDYLLGLTDDITPYKRWTDSDQSSAPIPKRKLSAKQNRELKELIDYYTNSD